jgi:hypothetical protein
MYRHTRQSTQTAPVAGDSAAVEMRPRVGLSLFYAPFFLALLLIGCTVIRCRLSAPPSSSHAVAPSNWRRWST